MTRDDSTDPTARIAGLARQVSAEPRLGAELQRARREFFGEDLDGPASDPAEHRFAEWFLLERESEVLGAVPMTVEPFNRDAEVLSGSIAGLFLVESTGSHVLVKDVQNDELLELAGGERLEVGDLLVGRLYPTGSERWTPSAATPAMRPGRELVAAVLRDIARLDLGRRLLQIELEHLLLRRYERQVGKRRERVGQSHDGRQQPADQAPSVPGPVPAPLRPLEHLEADLEQLLQPAGGQHDASILSQQLAAAPRPGALIGPLLDQLAFDTDVDLDRARQLLLEIWNAHHAGESEQPGSERASAGPPGETLGERLVRTLDEGLGEQRDVEELFAELERIAGIGDDEEQAEDGEDVEPQAMSAADGGDVGDLEPLVAEYEWETGQPSDEAGPLRVLVELQQNAAVPTTDVEAIGRHDLLRLLLHVFLRSAPEERSDRVRAAFAELTRFYDWLATTQELDRRDVLRECQGALLDEVDRLHQASRMLSTDEPPAQPPRLLQIEETGPDGFGARDDDGGHYWCRVAPAALANLRVGDLVLTGFARPDGGEKTSLERRLSGLVVVLPIDARAMIE